MIFVESPETVEQIEEIARLIPQPKLINMFFSGKTPLVPKTRLHELGYKFIIIPSDVQRASIKAVQRVAARIFEYGDSAILSQDMVSFGEREAIVGTSDYVTL